MADVTPTGTMGKAMINLRNLIAESSTFQTAIGATGTPAEKLAAAKLRIHLTAYERPADSDFVRPFALVCKTGGDTNEAVATNMSEAGGTMELRFDQDLKKEYLEDPGNAELYFLNFVDGVIADMWSQSNEPGYFALQAVDVIEGPTQIENEANVYNYSIRLNVVWGLTG